MKIHEYNAAAREVRCTFHANTPRRQPPQPAPLVRDCCAILLLAPESCGGVDISSSARHKGIHRAGRKGWQQQVHLAYAYQVCCTQDKSTQPLLLKSEAFRGSWYRHIHRTAMPMKTRRPLACRPLVCTGVALLFYTCTGGQTPPPCTRCWEFSPCVHVV